MNRARWILILLSLTVGGVGVLALARSILVTEAGRERDEMARRIQRRNEVCLKRVEELERVYREEVLPARKGLTRNRQQLEELFGTFTPELGAVASSRDLGKWPPGPDNEGGLAWDQVLPEVLRDPRIWSQAGFAGKDGG